MLTEPGSVDSVGQGITKTVNQKLDGTTMCGTATAKLARRKRKKKVMKIKKLFQQIKLAYRRRTNGLPKSYSLDKFLEKDFSKVKVKEIKKFEDSSKSEKPAPAKSKKPAPKKKPASTAKKPAPAKKPDVKKPAPKKGKK